MYKTFFLILKPLINAPFPTPPFSHPLPPQNPHNSFLFRPFPPHSPFSPPSLLTITKNTKDTKGFWMIRGLVDWEMWGAAPRPGREKFSLHPRHVCDVPTSTQGRAVRARKAHVRPEGPVGAWRASHAMLLGRGAFAPRRTENGACRREAPNLPRLRRTERPCGATAEGAVRERRSRSPIRPICPIGPTAKFDDVSRRVKREDDGREGAISGRLARKATGVSPSGFARTGVFAENESVNTNQPIS